MPCLYQPAIIWGCLCHDFKCFKPYRIMRRLACRYSAVIKNGKFKTFNLEPDGGGLSCSLAPTALEQLSQA